jgi:uncharacterized HhH-GPD family protein
MPSGRRGTIFITGDPDDDALLNTDPLALVIGLLLDQQVPMAWAFRGPATLRDRLGGLDAGQVAAMDPEELVAVFCAKPALHRYPAAMARRTHELCAYLVEHYDGDAARLWGRVRGGEALFDRVRALPGYGEEKAQILVALLAKRFAVRPAGWEVAAGVFSDATPRSVADSHDPASLAEVRAFKKAMKAAQRDKQGRPDS